jgi:hypothetical protein
MQLEQAIGRAEDAAVDADVFAEHNDARIVCHYLLQREIHGLHEIDLAHAAPAARRSASSSCSARSIGICQLAGIGFRRLRPPGLLRAQVSLPPRAVRLSRLQNCATMAGLSRRATAGRSDNWGGEAPEQGR